MFIQMICLKLNAPNKKTPLNGVLAGFDIGGAGGIRTRGGLLTHTRFPGVRLKPLIHRSEPASIAFEGHNLAQNSAECHEYSLHFALAYFFLEPRSAP